MVLRRLLLLLVAALMATGGMRAQTARPVVYVIAIDGTIDLGLAPFLGRTLRDAETAGAAAVLLDINTLGGRVDAALAMRDLLIASPVRTIAFVHPRAISAGALIALASDTIVMAGGGTLGAAMPVTGGTGPPQAADEKTVSYLRKEFGATAEQRGRPQVFAEAMVDADVEIPDVVSKGKLLTLTSAEALRHEVVEHQADSRDAALAAAGLADAELRIVSATWAEWLVRGVTHPVISSALMTIGLLGILVEMRTPGFALPGAVGLLSFALFFWGHWLVQLAGWEELLLVGLGGLLIALEVLVIPGFGVAGIVGLAALVAGLGLMLVGAGATATVVLGALGQVALALIVALVAALALLRVLPRLPFGRKLVLEAEMDASDGYASSRPEERLLLGRTGLASTPLRPAGLAEFDGQRVDVVSEGSYIEVGTPVEVTRVEGNRIVVRARHVRPEESSST